MGFKTLRAKKARKNEAVINIDGLAFHCKRVSFTSPEFLALYKDFLTRNDLMDKVASADASKWMFFSVMGSYQDDVEFLADCIVTGWEGFDDDNGKPVPFSPEAFKECFLDYDSDYEANGLKEIIATLMQMLNTPSTYAVSEDELKNS